MKNFSLKVLAATVSVAIMPLLRVSRIKGSLSGNSLDLCIANDQTKGIIIQWYFHRKPLFYLTHDGGTLSQIKHPWDITLGLYRFSKFSAKDYGSRSG